MEDYLRDKYPRYAYVASRSRLMADWLSLSKMTVKKTVC